LDCINHVDAIRLIRSFLSQKHGARRESFVFDCLCALCVLCERRFFCLFVSSCFFAFFAAQEEIRFYPAEARSPQRKTVFVCLSVLCVSVRERVFPLSILSGAWRPLRSLREDFISSHGATGFTEKCVFCLSPCSLCLCERTICLFMAKKMAGTCGNRTHLPSR